VKSHECPYCRKTLDQPGPQCPRCSASIEAYWASAQLAHEYLKKAFFFYKQGLTLPSLENACAAAALDNGMVEAALLAGKLCHDLGLKSFAEAYWERARILAPEDSAVQELVRIRPMKKQP
jgi:hypothetical protein